MKSKWKNLTIALKEKYSPSATDDYKYQKTTDGQQKAEKKLEQNKLNYECYYCGTFTPTDNRNDYEKHIVLEHDGKLAYPSLADLKRII
jgi:hypothetical protein